MRAQRYYHPCDICGANLDPGETCSTCYPREPITTGNDDYKSVKGSKKMYNGQVFVCLDEITGQHEPSNTVLLNPNVTSDVNAKVIYETIKERYGLVLTDDQLGRLVSLSSEEFYHALREMIFLHTIKK